METIIIRNQRGQLVIATKPEITNQFVEVTITFQNCVLLYCMYRYTLPSFRVFGLLMKVSKYDLIQLNEKKSFQTHTIFDLIGTGASFCAMQRQV